MLVPGIVSNCYSELPAACRSQGGPSKTLGNLSLGDDSETFIGNRDRIPCLNLRFVLLYA